MTTGASPSATKARCAGWPKGEYSASKDTPETVKWFGVYKRVGVKKRCWKDD